MSGLQTLAGQQQDQVLCDSIKPGRHMTLTIQIKDGWQTYKGKFEGGSSTIGLITAMILLPRPSREHPLAQSGLPVGCTFRLGHKKCMFSSVVDSAEVRSNGLSISFRWPNEIQQLQRRAYDRTSPPNGSIVAVRFWRDDSTNASTDGRKIRHGQLEDISAGGMRIKVADAETIEIGVNYRCTFTPLCRIFPDR